MKPQKYIDGLGFAEGPRWHEGRLWFSDMGDRVVRAVDVEAHITEVVQVAGRPSGLGWLEDGTLLVVSMDDRRVLRHARGELVEHAALSGYTAHPCNDMVVSAQGNAYVGHMGFDLFARPPVPKAAELLLVRADGSSSVAADELSFPNGVVITNGGRTLIVAETMGQRLTAFDVAADGTLGNRRLFAALPGRAPDGISLDAQGAVWVADASGNSCVRVLEGGEVTDVIETGRGCYACVLGGSDGRTLFLCTAQGFRPKDMALHTGAIERVAVAVPGAH